MNTLRSRLVGSFLLGMVALAAPASGLAQPQQPQQPQPWQGQGRPQLSPVQVSSPVARYLLGPFGHVRAMLLADGHVVMFRGPQGDTLAQQAPAGTAVRVEGFSPQHQPQVIARATVYGPNGAVLVAPQGGPGGMGPGGMGPGGMGPGGMGSGVGRGAMGPGMDRSGMGTGMGPGTLGQGGWRRGMGHGGMGHGGMGRGGMGPGGMGRGGMGHGQLQERLAQLPTLSVAGPVQTVLGGPRAVRGAVLADGTYVIFRGPLAHALAQHGGARVGEVLRITGHGNRYPLGTTVVADQVTFADGSALVIPQQAPPQEEGDDQD